MNLSSLTGKKYYNYKYIKNIFASNDDICCKSIIFNKITVSEIIENFNFMWSFKFNSFTPVIILSYPNNLWHILQYQSYQDFCSGFGQTSNVLWPPWTSCFRFHDHRQLKTRLKLKVRKAQSIHAAVKRVIQKNWRGMGILEGWKNNLTYSVQMGLILPLKSHPPFF